jgi:undecaprenyl-diphosphatase
MTWWQALILGIVEGVTEYLPVSSTGHLILVAWLLGLDSDPQQAAAVNTFNIVIQAGAILAVVGLYRRRIVRLIAGVLGRDADGRRLAIHLLIAFLPAAALGPLLADDIETYLFKPWPVTGALFVGAWLMFAVAASRRKRDDDDRRGRELEQLTWRIALLIGFGQCIAMWPGTSRSMMTIVAALMLGLRPKAAAEFSFLLGLITLSAATGYKVVFDGEAMLQTIDLPTFLIGLVAATISAAVAVQWFVAALVKHGLAPFAWYRLALACVLAVMAAMGWMTL